MQIIKKLNPVCQKVLGDAFSFCQQKKNFFVEIEHYLFKGLMTAQADFQDILRHYEIDISTVLKQLNAAVDRLKGENHNSPAYSPHLLMVFKNAWYISSVYLDLPLICSSTVLLSLVDYDPLRGIVLENCPLLLRIPRNSFRQDLQNLTRINGNKYTHPVQ